MKLLLDIGNTRVKWGVLESGEVIRTGEMSHASRSPDQILQPLLASQIEPDEIRIANVAGQVLGQAIADYLHSRFHVATRMARSAAAAEGLINGYADPAQLGVDRWLALCAAWERQPGALAVVDAGTATTVDIVTANGRHAGGLILPGIGMMESALRRDTGDLARLARRSPDSGIGQAGIGTANLACDTAAAIQLGPLQATLCLIDACLRRVDPATRRFFITGGDAPMLMPGLTAAGLAPDWRPHLVLEGLGLGSATFLPHYSDARGPADHA